MNNCKLLNSNTKHSNKGPWLLQNAALLWVYLLESLLLNSLVANS